MRARSIAVCVGIAIGAQPTGAAADNSCADAACVVDAGPAEPELGPAPSPDTLLVFWGHGCPHCDHAKPFIDQLQSERPNLVIDWTEVRRDSEGRGRFQAEAARLAIPAAGIPMFVFNDAWVVGFEPGRSEAEIRNLLDGQRPGAAPVALPGMDGLDLRTWPLPLVSLVIGGLDGINPCAIYVLVVLLGLLMRLQTTGRMVLYAGIFVLTSGVVYFGFMALWFNAFLFAGVSEELTSILGGILILMGLTNLKELFWFKQGVSLMIPDRAKPGLFKRMRRISAEKSPWLAIPAIFVLALVVNLIELGCTLGLPAVFTRMLSVRQDIGTTERYLYLALYNVAYIVPLMLIVSVFVVLRHRIAMSETRAKLLKAVSAALLLIFGLIFIFFPELLR